MDTSFFFNKCLIFIVIIALSQRALASQLSELKCQTYQQQEEKKQEDKKQDDKKIGKKEKPDQKPDIDKLIIKEVPKARKQSRPIIVAKPNVKIKAIKIIRPKIKKP